MADQGETRVVQETNVTINATLSNTTKNQPESQQSQSEPLWRWLVAVPVALILVPIFLALRPIWRAQPTALIKTHAPQELTGEDVRVVRRKEEGLRALTPLEDNRELNRMPTGSFGFMAPWAFRADPGEFAEDLTRGRGAYGSEVSSTRITGLSLEIHRGRDGEIHLVGFVSKGDALRISEGRIADEVLLFTVPWEEAANLACIPLARVEMARAYQITGSFQKTNSIEQRLELKLSASKWHGDVSRESLN